MVVGKFSNMTIILKPHLEQPLAIEYVLIKKIIKSNQRALLDNTGSGSLPSGKILLARASNKVPIILELVTHCGSNALFKKKSV